MTFFRKSPFPHHKGCGCEQNVNKLNQNRGVVNPPESAINPNNTKQYVLNRKTIYLYEAEWHSKGQGLDSSILHHINNLQK